MAAYGLSLETEPYSERRERGFKKKKKFCWIAIDHFSPWKMKKSNRKKEILYITVRKVVENINLTGVDVFT